MKRLFAIVVAAMMLFSIPTFAADLDLSSMSTEELVELQDKIKAELDSRGYSANDSTISEGTYRAGIDIKTGSFKVTATKVTGYFFVVTLYADQESYDNGKPINNNGNDGFLSEGDEATFTLTDGMILVISGGSGSIEETSPSWVP